MQRAFVLLLALLATALSLAQMNGKGQYPQARTLSGLPGGGSGVLPGGRPSIHGALALSTPIGYTLGKDSAILTGGTTSTGSSFRWFDGDVATNGSNGTAAVMFGTEVGMLNLGVSLVQTSRLSEDRIINLQLSQRGSGLSVGVQDLLDETRTTPNFYESAQTFYAAATHDLDGVFLTGGIGTKRFSKGFASASAPLIRNTRAMVEHDGFGWNYGVEVQLFDVESSRGSVFLGSCQGRYATWAVSWKF